MQNILLLQLSRVKWCTCCRATQQSEAVHMLQSHSAEWGGAHVAEPLSRVRWCTCCRATQLSEVVHMLQSHSAE